MFDPARKLDVIVQLPNGSRLPVQVHPLNNPIDLVDLVGLTHTQGLEFQYMRGGDYLCPVLTFLRQNVADGDVIGIQEVAQRTASRP
jgi:hypothetical protein